MDYSTYFLYAFFFHITNPKIGNTGMCCLVALMNQTWFLSQTLGFYLADTFEFEHIVPICLICQMVMLLVFFRFSITLDKMSPKEFDLTSDSPGKKRKVNLAKEKERFSKSFHLKMTQ